MPHVKRPWSSFPIGVAKSYGSTSAACQQICSMLVVLFRFLFLSPSSPWSTFPRFAAIHRAFQLSQNLLPPLVPLSTTPSPFSVPHFPVAVRLLQFPRYLPFQPSNVPPSSVLRSEVRAPSSPSGYGPTLPLTLDRLSQIS